MANDQIPWISYGAYGSKKKAANKKKKKVDRIVELNKLNEKNQFVIDKLKD